MTTDIVLSCSCTGLNSISANVWEWCWDLDDRDVYGSYRVLRGGGWADAHWSCRASVRRGSHPTFEIDDVGFRVARSVPMEPAGIEPATSCLQTASGGRWLRAPAPFFVL
ncbi:MAG TPA: SUMF1/EgtB/PvdO family nonheme iron enzyme [Baekduia sp.]|nr:SUMF1/EgtB/PvdO family nonheme iron enzyme [Baekduia sp.]